jgi:hypothetical protein
MAMSAAAYPSPARLARWLDEKPGKLERYLAAHPEAGAALDAELEQLTTLSDNARGALAAALVAPVDLSQRIRAKLGPTPTGTETSAVLLDLMGLGWRTAQVLFGDDPPAHC